MIGARIGIGQAFAVLREYARSHNLGPNTVTTAVTSGNAGQHELLRTVAPTPGRRAVPPNG